jgi:prolipoprotein diacylglyceryltransferase
MYFTSNKNNDTRFKHSLEPFRGIDLGFFIIRFYSLMFVIAFGLGWYIMKNIFEREGQSIEKLDSLLYGQFWLLLGARLAFFSDMYLFRNPYQ